MLFLNMPIKKGGFFASFFNGQGEMKLLHNELLGLVTSVDEVDTARQVADVEGVGTGVAFGGHHDLTHDVVDHDVSVLAEDDADLVGGGVGIDAHVRVVVLHFRHANAFEEVVQLEGEALVVVVSGVGIIALDEGTSQTVHLAGHHKGRADHSGLRIDAL